MSSDSSDTDSFSWEGGMLSGPLSTKKPRTETPTTMAELNNNDVRKVNMLTYNQANTERVTCESFA